MMLTLPLDTQSQLLRVLDGLDFHYAAGKPKSISVDVRFLFSSDVDLEKSVKEGWFRKDLYRRIGGSYSKINIPALRNTKQDIPLLAKHLIETYNKKHKIDYKLTDIALNVLLKHEYVEGNIAELKTLLEIACQSSRLEDNGIITKKHFQSIYNQDAISDKDNMYEIFNDEEIKKLSVLRNNHFRMDIMKRTLGFKPGSHTISHYLRGTFLKALSYSEWEIEPASEMIAGSELNLKTHTLLQTKMKGYIKNIISKKEAGQRRYVV